MEQFSKEPKRTTTIKYLFKSMTISLPLEKCLHPINTQ